MFEALHIRIHGPADKPAIIYLPGLHGDWTLVGGFRTCLGSRVRFVEFTYPRTRDWNLDDYAAAVESALAENGITRGWLLGESFGSQIVWALARRKNFSITGIILAGGFVKHPLRWTVQLAEILFGRLPFSLLVLAMFAFMKYARWRFRHSPATLAGVHEFIARRTRSDRAAAVHRLHLITENDPRPAARETKSPVHYLSGLIDPIVPWLFVQHWLKCHCPAFGECKIIPAADHNVLGTAPEKSAEHVLRWVET
jgi:pimeloyl-ACP methyl ester carboxylesterase